MALDLQDAISQLRSLPTFGRFLVQALQRLETAVNQVGSNMGVDATAKLPAPAPVNGLNVKASTDGFVHVAITDNNPVARNLQYFVEYDTSPAFTQPHVVDMGASRTHVPFKLPAKDDGGNPQTFYFRAYSQYHGSDPGPKVNYGGTTPTGITPGGTTQMSLLQSTGSGTASGSGTQGGQGLGRDVYRLPVMPKRSDSAIPQERISE